MSIQIDEISEIMTYSNDEKEFTQLLLNCKKEDLITIIKVLITINKR